jgi:Spy/CpxP family protein refolding chaperone
MDTDDNELVPHPHPVRCSVRFLNPQPLPWGAKFWLNQALGDEATPKVEAMWEVYRAKLEPMRKAARQSRHAIKAALSADPFDPNAYARPLEDSLNQRTGIRASHHDFMIELTSVLPPEQRVKLAERAGGRRWRHHRE